MVKLEGGIRGRSGDEYDQNTLKDFSKLLFKKGKLLLIQYQTIVFENF